MKIDDICAFIADEEARLQDKFGSNLNSIALMISSKGVRVWAFGKRGADRFSYQCAEGATPDEAAVRLYREHFPSREIKAMQLRDEARKLLRVAAELEKEATR